MVAIGIDRILNRAANWLEQHELHKDSFGRYADPVEVDYDPDEPEDEAVYGPVTACCALGAICRANDDLPTTSVAFTAAATALATSLNLHESHVDTEDLREWLFDVIGSWNDAAERTKDEVVAALRQAAKDEQRLTTL